MCFWCVHMYVYIYIYIQKHYEHCRGVLLKLRDCRCSYVYGNVIVSTNNRGWLWCSISDVWYQYASCDMCVCCGICVWYACLKHMYTSVYIFACALVYTFVGANMCFESVRVHVNILTAAVCTLLRASACETCFIHMYHITHSYVQWSKQTYSGPAKGKLINYS